MPGDFFCIKNLKNHVNQIWACALYQYEQFKSTEDKHEKINGIDLYWNGFDYGAG